MSGSGFGPTSLLWTRSLWVGPIPLTNCTVTSPDVEMVCVSPALDTPAPPGPLPVTLDAARVPTPAPSLRLRTPCLSSVVVESATGAAAVRGGDFVTLRGRNLGPLTSPVDYAVYGPGVRLQPEGVVDNVTALAAALVDTPRALLAPAAPAATVAGAPLFTALNCSVVEAQSSVRCVMAPGAGVGHVWALSIRGALAALCSGSDTGNVTTRYAAPTVTGVEVAAQWDAPAGSLQTEGGTLVRVSGSDFHSGAVASVGGVPHPSFVVLNDSAALLVALPGFGSGVGLQVTVGGQASNVLPLAYAGPRVMAVTVLPGAWCW